MANLIEIFLETKCLCFCVSTITPFIQIQQTRKGLPNADINNCIAGIHKVRKHKQTAFKVILYEMCLCRADAKWFILRMVSYHNKRFVKTIDTSDFNS